MPLTDSNSTIQITGVLSAAGNARGAYPVRVLSQVADAQWMRLGNTNEELQLASWQAYADDMAWLLPTGQQPKTLFAEYRLADQTVVSLQTAVPAFDALAGIGYAWPESPDPIDAQGQWHQDFSTGADFWAVYDYFDNIHPDNIYYPATWVSTGGSDGGGYILADDSRWRIDKPEDPDVVFPLAIRSEWLKEDYLALDFDGFSVDFDLKGEGLNLLGGQAYFYVFDSHGRAVKFDQPLTIVDGQWIHNRVVIDSLNDDAWDITFLPKPGLIDGSQLHSWGITFAGFSGEPTGVLGLDQFSITRIPRDDSAITRANTGSQITIKRDLGTVLDQLTSCALVGGGFVTAWRETALDGTTCVVAQQSSADGSQIQPRFLVAPDRTEGQSAPALSALADGGFALVWVQKDGQLPTGASLQARTFNALGVPTGPDFGVNSDHVSADSDAALASLPDGGFAVTWINPHDNGPDAGAVWLRSYSYSNPNSASVAVQLGSSGQTLAAALSVVQGVGLVAAWPNTHAGNPSGALTIQILNGDGQLLRTASVVAQDGASIMHSASAIALTDGRWVLAWAEATGGVDRLWAQVLGPDGSNEAPVVDVALVGALINGPVATTALTDDRFLLSWTVFASPDRAEVHGRVYSALDGSAQSAELVLQDPGLATGAKYDLLALTLTDGRALITWADAGSADGASGTAVLAQVVELRLAGKTLTGSTGADDWVGTPWDDVLHGLGGADSLVGRQGNDTYHLGSADATVVEYANQGAADSVLVNFDYQLQQGVQVEILATEDALSTTTLRLAGNEFANTLVGNAGNNILNYLAGDGPADVLIGGEGDDWFYVYRTGDQVVEAAGGGFDRVYTRDSYTLQPGQGIEVLTADDHAGTAPLVLAGNELANNLYGNAGNNVLDGGAGADSLTGLAGDDWYYVDNTNDVVGESAGEGYDRVLASISFVLPVGQEIEKLTTTNNGGIDPLTLTGNEFDNVIYGNFGDNVLDGGTGNDTMVGSKGNDWYFVNAPGDRVLEWIGEGEDRVLTSTDCTLADGQEIEKLTTTDNFGTNPLNLTGNSGSNTIYGNPGDNTIDGKGGVDTLVGMGGNDNFLFSNALGPNNLDTIIDFNFHEDRILLDHLVFSGLTEGALTLAHFREASQADLAGPQIVLDTTTATLYFDADGGGGEPGIPFLVIPGAWVSADQFWVV